MYYSHPLYVEDIKKISDYTFPWEKLENKKILITGASGMIGTVLVEDVYKRQHIKLINIC